MPFPSPRARGLWFLVLTLQAAVWLGPAFATPVDVSHPVYPFLRRLEIEGKVAPGHLGSLPIPRSEVISLLQEAQARADAMPAWQLARLASFREEFGLIESRDGRYHPLGYRDSTVRFTVHGESFNGGYVHDSIPRAQTHGFGFVSASLEGSYRERLQFLSWVGSGQERSLHPRLTENYNPTRGLPYNTDRTGKTGKLRTAGTFDAFRTVVGYEEPNLRLEFGSDWNQWGPGIWQHVLLSQQPWFWVQDSLPPSDSADFHGIPFQGSHRRGFRRPGEAAPMTQIRLAFRAGRFNYTKVLAERTGLGKDSVAHLVAHRLEFRPWDFLGIGMQEMAVTAGRPLDWTYAIPFIPIKYAEHQLGDRDNSAVGVDAEVLLHGIRMFGELLVDDWSGWDLDFWGDKYAYTLGAEGVGFPFAASRLQAEFAHVEPWVFTHRLPDHQMQSFGALLGSGIPANSHALRLAWEHAVRFDLDLRLEYAFMQRDAVSRGGSPFDVHDNAIDGTKKEFLAGAIETRNAVQAAGTWRWRRFLEFHGAVGYLSVDDWKSRPGASLSAPTFAGELTLRY
ncbi:MAG: hypothetical protein JWP91_244 [Fibrobacteres bacterium]|nr:hypothetical protein [Fibrobacterota bacterium]